MRSTFISAVVILFCLASICPRSAPAESSPGEIWIEARTDGHEGSGTVLDPFDGSEPAKFDAILSAAQPSTLIHIGVGTFVTRGITLKEGFHLVGRGKELTTIKLADGVQSSDISSTNVVAFWGPPKPLDYIEVRDLTLDANRAGQPSFQQNLSDHYIGGIITYVRRARIADVRVRGTWGNGSEAFVFAIVHERERRKGDGS